jgi:acetyl-CoA carboxylase biotin carboxyl carrier protein
MSLSAKDLDEIMQLFDRSGFGELKLETGDLKLHLRKHGIAAANPVAPAAAGTPALAPAPPAPSATPVAGLPPPAAGEVDVPSPLLGLFYRAPKPGEPPFIEVGQRVEDDTIIAIVEVMKLMNSVRAGVRGEVIAIHAANAEMVEFEQPLIRVRLAV